MPDTLIRLFKPTNPGNPPDFYSFYNDLTKALNDSLSTGPFGAPGKQGVIYRHPYIPVGTPTVGQVPIWNGTTYTPGTINVSNLNGAQANGQIAERVWWGS